MNTHPLYTYSTANEFPISFHNLSSQRLSHLTVYQNHLWSFKKMYWPSQCGWAPLAGVASLAPEGQGTYPGFGFHPGLGTCRRQPIDVAPSLPPPLKKNPIKTNYKNKTSKDGSDTRLGVSGSFCNLF